MEITTQEFKHCDLITIKGRVDSSTAPQMAQALETANESGKYKLVVDMTGLEYMSSAGFRALLAAHPDARRALREAGVRWSWSMFLTGSVKRWNLPASRNFSKPLMIR